MDVNHCDSVRLRAGQTALWSCLGIQHKRDQGCKCNSMRTGRSPRVPLGSASSGGRFRFSLLNLGATQAKSPSKSATNKGVGQATSCVQGHTRKRQASSLRYNAVPDSGRPSRPVFCVAVRPYVLLARHGSIEQDRTSNGPEGWIGLHTGSVSGLRGCSPQVPAVVVDEPRIFCLVREGRVGRCQGYVPTTLKGMFAAAAAARLETLSGSTRHWFPLARRRGLGDQRADGTSPRGAALPLFGRRPSGGVLIANEPALSSVDGLEPWTGMPFVWLTTNDRVFENR